MIGVNAGRNVTSGSQNIFIGPFAGRSAYSSLYKQGLMKHKITGNYRERRKWGDYDVPVGMILIHRKSGTKGTVMPKNSKSCKCGACYNIKMEQNHNNIKDIGDCTFDRKELEFIELTYGQLCANFEVIKISPMSRILYSDEYT